MAAMEVVPPFNEIEHRHPRLDLGLESAAVEQLAFEGGEDAFAHGVVETVAHRTHRRAHAGLLATLAEGERGILGGFKRSSQYLDRGNWEDYSKAPLGSIWASRVADRLGGRLELLSEIVRTTPCSHQLHHPAPVFRRIPRMTLGYCGSPSLSPLRHCPRNRVNSR